MQPKRKPQMQQPPPGGTKTATGFGDDDELVRYVADKVASFDAKQLKQLRDVLKSRGITITRYPR